MTNNIIAIIGGGPAGLMAAQQLVGKGYDVHLFDAMPSLGRKFLMAGKSGMNLTHSENLDLFLSRYSNDKARALLSELIRDFTPDDIRSWVTELGIETFVGSSGRVFPTDFKAAPLLRSWLRSLKAKGLKTHVRHKWTGWNAKALTFDTTEGIKEITPKATIFAMGAKSWPKLGSDGAWQTPFAAHNINLTSFEASNCGFNRNWNDFFIEKFAGQPIKSVALCLETDWKKGEFVITSFGVEGSAIYSHSRELRKQLKKTGQATLYLDLTPDRPVEKLLSALKKDRGSKSLSNHIRRATGLDGVKAALLRECLDKDSFSDMDILARSIKRLPLQLHSPRPIEEAISCAGGVCLDQINNDLMIKDMPGYFLAGEMLDWDAPTGGYLLSACFATGKRAGLGAARFLGL